MARIRLFFCWGSSYLLLRPDPVCGVQCLRVLGICYMRGCDHLLFCFFSCLFVAWARVTCNIPGLPSNRSFDRLIVARVLLDLKWCLCGFDLLLGRRRDLCTIVHQYIALFNRLDYCSYFHLVCTPLLPKVTSRVGLSSISLRLTPESMTSS